MFRIYQLLLICCLTTVPAFGQSPDPNVARLYTVDELKTDLRTLRKQLETTHPALYRYTPKPVFTSFFDSLNQVINVPMNEQEFLCLITLLNSKICDGHTMFLPSETASEYNNRSGSFFPFSLAYLNQKLYIRENCSANADIERGEEIVAINGESAAMIMNKLMARQIRDGYNETYPTWILNHYFAAYYSFVYGHPSQFSLTLKNNQGKFYTQKIAALHKDSITHFQQARYSVQVNKGISLEINQETAVLAITTFDPDLPGSVYSQNYDTVIDSIFSVLRQHRTSRLMLDLRDNQGGDFEPGRYLLSYLITAPTRYLLSGKEARLIRPKKNHFTGKLFVLINGGSFSNTAIVSACLERAQRAVFIGEESGGNKHIISGKPGEILLPNTRLRCYISTTTFHIVPGPNNGHGLIPKHPAHATVTDIQTGKDASKEIALRLILK